MRRLVVYEGSGNFIKKLKNIDHNPQNAIMLKANAAGLYTSIRHDADLEALKNVFDNRVERRFLLMTLPK